MNNGHRRDVQIFAPIAASGAKNNFGVPAQIDPPTPEELVQMLSAENTQLQKNAKLHATAAGTMAAIALSFAQMLVDAGIGVAGDRTVRIPQELFRRMHGCQITASTDAVTQDGDVLVHIRERVDSPQLEN